MRAKTIFLAPALLIAALSLSACSGVTATPAFSTAPAAEPAAPQVSASASSSAPTPAQTPTNVPSKGLYMLITGEPGTAKVSIVHYTGGKSEADRKDGANYKEQALTVKVPSYVELKLDGLSQISEKTTKDGQSLGCDFVYNGEFRPKNAPTPTETAITTMCYETGFANTQ